MSYSVKNAKIEFIGEIKSFDSGFKKVEFVVVTSGEYPQYLKFDVLKDKADNLIKFNKVGDFVDISFDLNGRKYEKEGNTMYFTNLTAWLIKKAGSGNEQASEVDGSLPF